MERTPVSSIVNALPFRGEHVPIASELFATTRDVYLTLGDLEPQPSDLGTANGKPATKSYARDRLAHLFCLDRDSFEDRDATEAAEAVDRQLTARIATALAQVTGRFDENLETVIVSGQGEFFIRGCWNGYAFAAAWCRWSRNWGKLSLAVRRPCACGFGEGNIGNGAA